MKKILFLLVLPAVLFAKINVAVSYPFIGALVKSIGADQVTVTILAKGHWDPHFVVPRPSLIAKVRQADALIINGGQLEIGWLPPLIRRANNPKTRANAETFLNLSHTVSLIQKPLFVDRTMGDIHPDGNPHFHLDPNIMLQLAHSVSDFLAKIDPDNTAFYHDNRDLFSSQWKEHMKRWQKIMEPHKGEKIIQFHNNLAYFNRAYHLVNIGTIEPLPGIPPSSKHTLGLLQTIANEHPCCILHDVYHSTKTAEYLVDKTGIKLIMMPHDINALDEITDLVKLFDYLTGAL